MRTHKADHAIARDTEMLRAVLVEAGVPAGEIDDAAVSALATLTNGTICTTVAGLIRQVAASATGARPGGEPATVRAATEQGDGEEYFDSVALALENAGWTVQPWDYDDHDDPAGGAIILPLVVEYGLGLIWEDGGGWTIGYSRYPGQPGITCQRTLDGLGERPTTAEIVALVNRIAAARTIDGEGRIR